MKQMQIVARALPLALLVTAALPAAGTETAGAGGAPVLAVPAPDARVAGPETVLRDTTARLLARVADEGDRMGDPLVRRALVRELVAPHVDFPRIEQRVLGRHWREATPAQRARFGHELEKIVYRSFADLLVGEEDARIDYGPARGKPGSGRVSVRSTLYTRTHKPLDVRFRLLSSPSGWKLYDLVVEGVSLVTTYRAAFDHEVQESGLDGLIESLASKNRAIDERDHRS